MLDLWTTLKILLFIAAESTAFLVWYGLFTNIIIRTLIFTLSTLYFMAVLLLGVPFDPRLW